MCVWSHFKAFSILPNGVTRKDLFVSFIYFQFLKIFLTSPSPPPRPLLPATPVWVFHMTHNPFRKWSRIHKSGGSGEAGGRQAGSPGESSLPTFSLSPRRERRPGRGRPACTRDGGYYAHPGGRDPVTGRGRVCSGRRCSSLGTAAAARGRECARVWKAGVRAARGVRA